MEFGGSEELKLLFTMELTLHLPFGLSYTSVDNGKQRLKVFLSLYCWISQRLGWEQGHKLM